MSVHDKHSLDSKREWNPLHTLWPFAAVIYRDKTLEDGLIFMSISLNYLNY